MIASMIIAVPTGIKIFNWLATLWHGNISLDTAMLYALGFVSIFTIGGLSGIYLAAFPIDWQVHDSYFVVAHFHYTLLGGVVFAIFAGLFYWWPKMFGRFLSERLGKWTFVLLFVGFNVAFFPQHLLGLLGMPRRVYTYRDDGTLESSTKPEGAKTLLSAAMNNQTYDESGQLSYVGTMTNAHGVERTFSTNNLGQFVRIQEEPDGVPYDTRFVFTNVLNSELQSGARSNGLLQPAGSAAKWPSTPAAVR
jgi:heme/copper-type cytochrome/quinol oxidase subunit 1